MPDEAIKTVPMIRAVPLHEGGPTTADVHPDEVVAMEAAGWIQGEAPTEADPQDAEPNGRKKK